MLNWIVSDRQQYLEPFKLVNLRHIELFEIEVFVHFSVSKQMTDV